MTDVSARNQDRADLGTTPRAVGGDDLGLVVGHRLAAELPLELALDELDVLRCDHRGKRLPDAIAEHVPRRVVAPRDHPVAVDNRRRNAHLLERGCQVDQPIRFHCCPPRQAMNGISSGAIVTNGRIMSRSSCSRMWQWYMYRPL